MDSMDSTVQVIPYYSQPHVFTVINNNTYYDETVAQPATSDNLPYSTVVVTGADSGIDNTFVRLTDYKTKKELFGEGDFNKYGQPSLQADQLFNGYTNVWFCRALPDNALYANIVLVANYRIGNVLNDLGQETGKKQLEVKFSTAYANKPYLTEGARSDEDITEFAKTLYKTTPDPRTGYMSIPLCYIRSTGRGQYGNNYSISITRDTNAEKEYEMKMYDFNVLINDRITRIKNVFSGSFIQAVRYQMSTLISDVIDQYSTGSTPVMIFSFEESFELLFETYQNIIQENASYIQMSGQTDEDVAELKEALKITRETFDPIFGYKYNTRTGEQIPYYRNYTAKSNETYQPPALTVPNTAGATKPLNLSEWSSAFVGARVLMISDPLNGGMRWSYHITSIDADTGNIVYDDGEEAFIDEDQYDGLNLSETIGHMLDGGHDGDFQEISVNGEMRTPNNRELQLLLAREYVKCFRGEKDRKILSPARVSLDFIFDANYNMTSDDTLTMDDYLSPLYTTSAGILTDADSNVLSVLTGGSGGAIMDFTDLNVKQAIYDLNEFRNRDGMTVNLERGVGTSLYLDCGLVGLKNMAINYELMDIINMMGGFLGRQTSIDLGYYQIFDPKTSKRITVTVTYFIAKHLVEHIMRFGINKPFVNSYAVLNAITKDNASLSVTGEMIRDSFRPDIDLIDWDVKEKLYKSRINYYVSTDEGRIVKRMVQNTREMDASALLEENNVRVLNVLKKELDAACQGYLYEWNEPTVRQGFTDCQMKKYRPWIGTIVQDLSIFFTANEFEQERMMMHAYVSVKFRDIIKRIILEFNIDRPDYGTSNDEGGEE